MLVYNRCTSSVFGFVFNERGYKARARRAKIKIAAWAQFFDVFY